MYYSEQTFLCELYVFVFLQILLRFYHAFFFVVFFTGVSSVARTFFIRCLVHHVLNKKSLAFCRDSLISTIH